MPRWELPDAAAVAVKDVMFEDEMLDDFCSMFCVLEEDLGPYRLTTT